MDEADQSCRMMVGAAFSGGSVAAGSKAEVTLLLHPHMASGSNWHELNHVPRSSCGSTGIDNAVQMTIITSTGERLTINNYQHPEHSVVAVAVPMASSTSITYRTYQQLPVVLYFVQVIVINTTVMKASRMAIVHRPPVLDSGYRHIARVEHFSSFPRAS
ncbi:hypothetical protein BKA83DRAFT_2148574 [Pisolithus microcarpus]|nr:hypothetical protein BKA83DRAFT_2148574 [Pisolithus microcarpus]